MHARRSKSAASKLDEATADWNKQQREVQQRYRVQLTDAALSGIGKDVLAAAEGALAGCCRAALLLYDSAWSDVQLCHLYLHMCRCCNSPYCSRQHDDPLHALLVCSGGMQASGSAASGA